MKALFQGFTIKDWVNENKETNKYTKYNKILVKNCIAYYFKKWCKRNELYHSPIMQLQVLKEQARRLKEKVKAK